MPVQSLADLNNTPTIMYDIGSGSLDEYVIPDIVVQAKNTGEPKIVRELLDKNAGDFDKTVRDVTNAVKNIRLWFTRLARDHAGLPILHSFWVFPQDMQVNEQDSCPYCKKAECNLQHIAKEIEDRFARIGLREYAKVRFGRLGTLFDDVSAHNDLIAEHILQSIITLQEITAKEIAKADGKSIKGKLPNWRQRQQELQLVIERHVPDSHPNFEELRFEVGNLEMMINEAEELIR